MPESSPDDARARALVKTEVDKMIDRVHRRIPEVQELQQAASTELEKLQKDKHPDTIQGVKEMRRANDRHANALQYIHDLVMDEIQQVKHDWATELQERDAIPASCPDCGKSPVTHKHLAFAHLTPDQEHEEDEAGDEEQDASQEQVDDASSSTPSPPPPNDLPPSPTTPPDDGSHDRSGPV